MLRVSNKIISYCLLSLDLILNSIIKCIHFFFLLHHNTHICPSVNLNLKTETEPNATDPLIFFAAMAQKNPCHGKHFCFG